MSLIATFISKININKSKGLLLSLPSIFNLKKYHSKVPVLPPIDENDIVESQSKGTGPGGQHVNKTSNRCQLKHIPTG
jgi:protein subunit release factor B